MASLQTHFSRFTVNPQLHVQKLNTIQSTYNDESSFPFFPLLPTELCPKIRRHFLQHERIIEVSLKE